MDKFNFTNKLTYHHRKKKLINVTTSLAFVKKMSTIEKSIHKTIRWEDMSFKVNRVDYYPVKDVICQYLIFK